MKKGYTKVLLIETIMILFLIFNSFIVNIFSSYVLVLFLFLSLCIFKIFFDFEKDRHRNANSVLTYLVIYLLIVLIIYYAIGLITGYIYTQNYYTIYGIFTFILPTILTIIISEFLRYQLLRKSEGNFNLIVLTTILFILVDVSNAIYFADFNSGYQIIVFIGLTLLPSICKNIFASYTSSKTGYRPAMLLNLSVGLYQYLLPIIPNFNEYFQSMFSLIVLTTITFVIYRTLKRELKEDELDTKTSNKPMIYAYVIEVIIAIILLYFISGYFQYYAIAIASNSMYPTFERGSVVIIKKMDSDYSNLEVDDIIAYNYENKIIAHRINKIIEIDGERYYYTKGDANQSTDNYVITEDMIMGKINAYIPFLGYPTILLNELLDD